jgi:hypothetical protein
MYQKIESSKTLPWKLQISGRWHCIYFVVSKQLSLSLHCCGSYCVNLLWLNCPQQSGEGELDTKRGKPDCCLCLVNMHFNYKYIWLKCGCVVCMRVHTVVFCLVREAHKFYLIINEHLTNGNQWNMTVAVTETCVLDRTYTFSLLQG